MPLPLKKSLPSVEHKVLPLRSMYCAYYEFDEFNLHGHSLVL